ncbi:MAG TPA: hypothetical protein VMV24_02495 [Candidatus Dormibacteraeota bacterium]|nr:hypothetical protein [Candidatus Dormibacteraeota bacterium]
MRSIEHRLGGELPEIEVSDKQIDARLNEWLELAKAHTGELVMVYEDIRHVDLYMARIRSDIDEVAPSRTLTGITIAESPTISNNGYGMSEHDYALSLDITQMYESFQLYRPWLGEEYRELPKVQVVFGNEAVADWFIQSSYLPYVEPYIYVQMTKRLGFEPKTTPEIIASVADYRDRVIINLAELVLKQTRVNTKIDKIYKSVGGGAQSLHGGLAIGMAPENAVEASFRTHQDRLDRDNNAKHIDRLKRELISLGIEKEEFYQTIAEIFGLSLDLLRPE